MKNSLIWALGLYYFMVHGVPSAQAMVEITPISIVNPSSAFMTMLQFWGFDSPFFKWVCYGLDLGMVLLVGSFLLWNKLILKRTLRWNHFLFVLLAGVNLSIAIHADLIRARTENVAHYFLILLRIQLVLSAVGIFSRLKSTESKQKIGSIFSGLLGGVLSASLLNFFFPVEAFLLIYEIIVVLAALILGIKQFIAESNKTLFYQLVIVICMGFTLVWLPELKLLSTEAYPIFALLEFIMMGTIAASSVSSMTRLNTHKFAQLKKEIYTSEMRVLKQNQAIRMLQTDCNTLQAQLQQEANIHRQDEIRDGLKIKALEEMSKDIANSITSYLKEIENGCMQIMNETRSPKFRLQRIRVFAEHASQLAVKVQEVMSFSRHHGDSEEGKLVNAGELLRECLHICRGKITRNGVDLEIETFEEDLCFQGQVSFLAQGFLGLLYNALEATETADVRRITVRLKRVESEGASWVEFAVSNSGAGIPTGIKAKVFHSRIREALGSHSLGLSMAFGIFETFGGSLSLDTEAVATTFVARLPLFQNDEEFSLQLAV